MMRILAICLLVLGASIAQAAAPTVATQDDLSAFKELQQSKLEAQKELRLKDVESVRQQIAAVDKRVDDQLTQLGQSVDRFGIVITVLGVGITVLLVLGSFLGYRNAKSEAKEAASDAARTSAQAWLEGQTTQLKAQIEALEHKAAQVHGQMDQHAQDVMDHASEVNQALRTAQESIGKTGTQYSSELEKSTEVLARRDRELKDTNEDSYSFDDWSTRAHAAYTAGKLDDAAYFWNKAAAVQNAGAANVASVLVNRAIAQGRLNQSEAAIATYDEVVRRFGDATQPALCILVARALVNRGALEGQLNKPEVAEATFLEVLRRFGDATEPALREQVTNALNGAGFSGLLKAKAQGPSTPVGKTTLRAALDNLNDAVARSVQPDGSALGNRAYAQCLLGHIALAESDFAAALRAPVNGGRKLYEATLKDFDIHPVAEDASMCALVEQAWKTYQAESGV